MSAINFNEHQSAFTPVPPRRSAFASRGSFIPQPGLLGQEVRPLKQRRIEPVIIVPNRPAPPPVVEAIVVATAEKLIAKFDRPLMAVLPINLNALRAFYPPGTRVRAKLQREIGALHFFNVVRIVDEHRAILVRQGVQYAVPFEFIVPDYEANMPVLYLQGLRGKPFAYIKGVWRSRHISVHKIEVDTADGQEPLFLKSAVRIDKPRFLHLIPIPPKYQDPEVFKRTFPESVKLSLAEGRDPVPCYSLTIENE